MKKMALILITLLIMLPSICGAWSSNDYTNEEKAIVADALTKAVYDIDGNGVVDSVDTGGGSGNVTGPASATSGNFPVLDATGKILSDSGTKPSDFLTTITGSESAFDGWDKNASDDFTWDYDFADIQNVPAYLLAETDPDFAAWLLATPPIYTETDPAVGTHEGTYDHTLISTALQAEVDGSTTNEIEVQDEDFNATNFNGATATGVSQDDFYDRFHLFDADDDGVFTDELWFPSGGIDWTADQGAVDIHPGNYTDTNTTYSAGTGMSLTGTTFNCTVTDTNTTYTAGDALTLTGTDIDFDGGATPSGDLGGTWSSPSVSDDSHAHTGTTISGIDISDDTNLAGTTNEIALTGDTLSLAATIDLGGKTSLEVPNATDPTTDAAGEIAVDSSAAPGSGIRFYGDAAYTLAGTYSKSFVILNPVATDDYPIWCTPYAITIKRVRVQCLGGTNIVGQLTECDGEGINAAVVDSSDITATANNSVDDDGTLSNPSIDAGDYVGWTTTSISGTPTSVTVTVDYTINQVN